VDELFEARYSKLEFAFDKKGETFTGYCFIDNKRGNEFPRCPRGLKEISFGECISVVWEHMILFLVCSQIDYAMERKLNMERFRMASISSSNNEASYP
jgi:type III secretory pathway component EscU